MMLSASPGIKPPYPQLCAHAGTAVIIFFQTVKCDLPSAAKVCRRKQVLHRCILKNIIGRAIRLEQWYIDSAFAHHIPQRLDIFFVISKGTVFVFHLHHQNRSTLCDLQRRKIRHQHFVIVPDVTQIPLVARPQRHIAVCKQPCRESAKLPFRADIRGRTQDHPQSELLRKLYIAYKVCQPVKLFPGKIKLALFRLVQIPRYDRLYGIAAQRL